MIELHALVTILIRSLVSNKCAVDVSVFTAPGDQTLFRVHVDQRDRGKLIGKQGRTARSLRILLSAMGKEIGQNFVLDLDERPPL